MRRINQALIAFDLVLGTAALLAPRATMRALGHGEPSEDATHMMRRLAPIWLTYSAAHGMAAARGNPEDWMAVAWLRGTEIATDVLWSRSPSFSKVGKVMMWGAGAANLALALGFRREARSVAPS